MNNNKKQVNDEDMESFVRRTFEDNFLRLRFENGHGLTAEVKEAALRHVILYWRKLKKIAETVTDTEVRLNLPGQETPKKRKFNIEGIVDIVRAEGRTVMYDLKTLDPEYVRNNISEYERQLNVYAHIWKNLRGQDLDETAIIATQFPPALDSAYENSDRDPGSFDAELEKWDPVIKVPFDERRVEETILEFGEIVDSIEDGKFSPAPFKRLKEKDVGIETFATRVCRNCDARFSCNSYREYIKSTKPHEFRRFKDIFEDTGSEEDRQNRLDEGIT